MMALHYSKKLFLLSGTTLLYSTLIHVTTPLAQAEPLNTNEAKVLHQQAAASAYHARIQNGNDERMSLSEEPLEETLLEIVKNKHSAPLRITVPNMEQDMPMATPEPVIVNQSAAERHLSSLLSKPSSFSDKKTGRISEETKTPLISLGTSDAKPSKKKKSTAKQERKENKPVQTAKKQAPKPQEKARPSWNELHATPNTEPAVARTSLPWVAPEVADSKTKTKPAKQDVIEASLDEWVESDDSDTFVFYSPLPWLEEKKHVAEKAPEPAKLPQAQIAAAEEKKPAAKTPPKDPIQSLLSWLGVNEPQKKSESVQLAMSEAKPEPLTHTPSPTNKLDTFPPDNVLPWLCEVETIQTASKIVQEDHDFTVETNAYVSPAIIIKRERIQLPLTNDVLASASPEQLAAYAPAAGQTASDSEPLIQLPEAPEKAPTKIEPPTAPVADTPAPEKIPPAPKAENTAPVKTIVENLSGFTGHTSQPDILPTLAPAKPATPVTKTVEAPPPAKPAKPKIYNKPVDGFSDKSDRIIRTLAPIADEPAREPKGLVMDRAKDTSGALEAEMGSVKHEAEGVNIEVKTPSINISYELEKAYNALITGQPTTASTIYQRVLAYNPNNVDALFGLATIYHRSGQIEAARPLYGKILAQEPDHREAMNNFLGLLADEAPEAALRQLAQLEKKSPKFSPIPAQMAIIYQKQGDLAKASEKMFRAVALAPENLTYRYNLAIMLDKQKNYAEAMRMYEILLQAHNRGESVPGNVNKIQERLTFLRSNSR